ncbi:unnamed protein product [Symbiodinium natans]|uniref:Uncharacterized protein n=1 Tax=Symbiodinium natans TaxID=878477 RepID=A0A812V4W4_9DINO|nr:unnamed protein product [Symbiodinium natans]
MAEEDESSPEGAHEPIDEEDDDADGTMREIMETPTSRRSRTRTRSPVAERSSSAKASGSAAKASGVGGTTNDSSVGAKAKTSATGAETTTSAPAVLPKTMGAAKDNGGCTMHAGRASASYTTQPTGDGRRRPTAAGSRRTAATYPGQGSLWGAATGDLHRGLGPQHQRHLDVPRWLPKRQCAASGYGATANSSDTGWAKQARRCKHSSCVGLTSMGRCSLLLAFLYRWGCAAHRAPEPDSTMDKNRHATPAHMCAQLPARDCNSPSSDSIPPDPLQILLKPAHPCDSFTRVNGEIACCKGTFSDEATYEVSQPGTDTCLGIPRADRGVAAAAI